MPELPIPVALARQGDYAPESLMQTVDRVFAAIGYAPSRRERVLVKPNLVSARGSALACSEPAVVGAVCAWLLDHGCSVTAGDSPAFGSAEGVARKVGLMAALEPLGVPMVSLDRPAALKLTLGGGIGLSARAMEADHIVNVPRLKAHCQMRVTAAVKNLFGCVTGMRKAVAHTRFGEQANRFESMILDVASALPPVTTLLDAVICMHRDGPTGGDPFPLGMVAASRTPAALDTAIYTLLGLAPAEVALWREAQSRALPGARPEDIAYPLERPEAFDAAAFIIPATLKPVTFHPLRLAKGALVRLKERLT